jgi:hypothetical protein
LFTLSGGRRADGPKGFGPRVGEPALHDVCVENGLSSPFEKRKRAGYSSPRPTIKNNTA